MFKKEELKDVYTRVNDILNRDNAVKNATPSITSAIRDFLKFPVVLVSKCLVYCNAKNKVKSLLFKKLRLLCFLQVILMIFISIYYKTFSNIIGAIVGIAILFIFSKEEFN